MITLLIVAGAVCFWGFKSGDSRSFQIAKNLDIFNSIVKELDMFYVDTIDPNKTIREGIFCRAASGMCCWCWRRCGWQVRACGF